MPIINCTVESVPDRSENLGQHRTIPALRLKHRSDSCGTTSAAPRSPYRHLELCGIALGIDQPLPLNRDLKYTFPR